MHPSYRDLVIEELAADSSLRSRFLEMADLEGIKLAVSQAGGSKGQRKLPLLISPEDWKVLSRRRITLIGEGNDSTSVSLIKVLRSALVDLSGEDRSRLLTVLAQCYDAVRASWDSKQAVISEGELREVFEASVLIDPIPVLPRLGPTWRSAVSAMREAVKDSTENAVALDADVVAEWIGLTELLSKNEPRFMRQMGFPKVFVGDVAQILTIVEGEAQSDAVPEDSDDIWGEADRMDTLVGGLAKLAELLPDARDRILEVQALASSQEDYLRERHKEASPSDDGVYDSESHRRENSAAPLDLDALFKDL